MTRIPLIDRASAPASVAGTLDAIQGAFGATPNMFRTVAQSPAALNAMWGFFGALGNGGSVDAHLGEKIAVAVANRNDCHYCLAAHTALGRRAGASAAEMGAAQTGQSEDPRTAAALAFALKLVEERGQVTEADVHALRFIRRGRDLAGARRPYRVARPCVGRRQHPRRCHPAATRIRRTSRPRLRPRSGR